MVIIYKMPLQLQLHYFTSFIVGFKSIIKTPKKIKDGCALKWCQSIFSGLWSITLLKTSIEFHDRPEMPKLPDRTWLCATFGLYCFSFS